MSMQLPHYHYHISANSEANNHMFIGKQADCPYCVTTHVSKEWGTIFYVSFAADDHYHWYFESNISGPFVNRDDAVADFERWQNTPQEEDQT
jgi:hypothetical protein